MPRGRRGPGLSYWAPRAYSPIADGPDGSIVRRRLDTDSETPTAEGAAGDELRPIWSCIEITFSDAGYRITVEQDGVASFVRTG